jgi:hypothetical protein
LAVVPSTTGDVVVDELVPLTSLPVTVLAGAGGSVEIRVGEDGLEVGGLEVGPVVPAEGWSFSVEAASGSIVAVAFASIADPDQMSVNLSAELSGDSVQVRLVFEDLESAEDGDPSAAVAGGVEGDGEDEDAAAPATDDEGSLATYPVREAGGGGDSTIGDRVIGRGSRYERWVVFGDRGGRGR